MDLNLPARLSVGRISDCPPKADGKDSVQSGNYFGHPLLTLLALLRQTKSVDSVGRVAGDMAGEVGKPPSMPAIFRHDILCGRVIERA